jgi:hypothetical protein
MASEARREETMYERVVPIIKREVRAVSLFIK